MNKQRHINHGITESPNHGIIRIRVSVFLCFCVFLVLPFAAPVDAASEYDLGLKGEDITLSPTEPVVGQKFRIYAKVHNEGSKDASGFVTFMQGPGVIGTSQIISVRAGGLADEVFVDLTAPTGQFNILARIQGQDPRDDNPANDTALTPMITPLVDTDGDGIPDRDDPDQDNDGLPNTGEAVKGTNPLVQDTDGDKVNDGKDAFPLDPKKSEAPPPTAPVRQSVKAAKPLPKPVEEKQPEPPPTPVVDIMLPGDAPKKEEPWIALRAERGVWNQFRFSFETNVVDLAHAVVSWDFGDYEQSRDARPEHTYARAGTYPVRLTLITADGRMLTDAATIQFSFFHPKNRQLWGLIFVLTIVAVIPLAWAYARRRIDAEEG
ncbi:PKD domain-containing protein [Candidatus Uhrbacteria bacterium]|nr:PKD domain-containing protein [Candidatus Uhrbacteria bacterium]